MQILITICWLILSLIHLFPALAFFIPSMIKKLYGISQDDPLFALLHHRAALFLIVFAVALFAAFNVETRKPAMLIVGFSMLSFIYTFLKNNRPTHLKSIFIADIIGMVLLLIVGIASIL